MCLSKTPNIPAPPPPPQEVKMPDTMSAVRSARSKSAGFGGGTMLTGPSGLATGTLNTAGATLLGG